MTRDESLAAFNALFTSKEIDPVAIEKFRTDMMTDYETFVTTQTTNDSLQSKVTELTETNTKLRDTNLQLIMMHPITSKEKDTSENANNESKELTEEEKQEVLDKVLAGFKRG